MTLSYNSVSIEKNNVWIQASRLCGKNFTQISILFRIVIGVECKRKSLIIRYDYYFIRCNIKKVFYFRESVVIGKINYLLNLIHLKHLIPFEQNEEWPILWTKHIFLNEYRNSVVVDVPLKNWLYNFLIFSKLLHLTTTLYPSFHTSVSSNDSSACYRWK